jgi:acetoin:2,6-dichlorophenolindophenol oxidoreductase subunit beta
VGAAVGGLRPVVDIMFSSFAYVAFDQLVNQAGRLRYMTGGQLAVPLVVVGSAGAAGSNAAQHSEVPSALFLQSGGLRVVFPSTPHQAFWLMRAAIESEDPVVVLHHPALGATRGSVSPEPLGLGDAQVDPVGSDVSVFATGMMAHRARAAARSLEAEGISVEVVDVCSLNPMPWDAILASVEKTGRAVVVDESRLTCSVASEIAAGLAERAFGALRTGIRRLAVPDVPIPFAPNLEQAVIPGEGDIAAAAREAVRG